MTMTKEDTARAKEQARTQLDSIVELVNGLENGATIDEEELDSETIRERILEDPLSVEVRTDWHTPGEDEKPTEYCILLCTGGPAVRIVGDLDDLQCPDTAKLEYQDWFTTWTRYGNTTDEEDEALLTYARQFYFGS